MSWLKPLAGLSVALVAFGATGAVVNLGRAVAGSTAALVVAALVIVAVLVAARLGTAPNRWLSNPYWGR